MKNVLLYNQGTCYNHGCEALVRTICGIIEEKYPGSVYCISSSKPHEDKEYIDEENGKYNFVASDVFCKCSFETKRLITGGVCTILGGMPFFSLLYKNTVKAAKKADVAISIGGDTYSYGKSAMLTTIDRNLRRHCKNTVLWGCSINPEYLDPEKHKKKINELKKFSLITARETITYETLRSLGFENVKYYPDPAFTLPTGEVNEPMFENDRDIVGINISPLAQSYEQGDNIMLKNYVNLVKMILGETDFNVALISHVRCKTTDDSDAAKLLLGSFQNEERIRLFDQGNAIDLKGKIAKCRFFVAARTHASIAAYSNCVPTIVVGYSVKAKGIAKDLFGTYDGYVIPVQEMKNEDSLKNAFADMMKNEESIRTHLREIMPGYIEKARAAGDEIVNLLEKNG